MVDTLTPEQRSERMSRIRARDTRPEMRVRRLVHAMGYRYRLHRRDLPEKPDLVFPGRRRIILVHGCIWHRHVGCRMSRLPKSRVEFWTSKLEANAVRYAATQSRLAEMGWSVLVVWECELADEDGLGRKIDRFLSAGGDDAVG